MTDEERAEMVRDYADIRRRAVWLLGPRLGTRVARWVYSDHSKETVRLLDQGIAHDLATLRRMGK